MKVIADYNISKTIVKIWASAQLGMKKAGKSQSGMRSNKQELKRAFTGTNI